MFHRYLSCIVPCTCANAAIPIPVNTTSQHRHPPSQADESQCQKPISGFPRGVLYTKRLQETLQQERKAAMASMNLSLAHCSAMLGRWATCETETLRKRTARIISYITSSCITSYIYILYYIILYIYII